MIGLKKRCKMGEMIKPAAAKKTTPLYNAYNPANIFAGLRYGCGNVSMSSTGPMPVKIMDAL
jgi:hypothetical protein